MRSVEDQFLLGLVLWAMYTGTVCHSPSFPCSSCVCRNISVDTVLADCSNRNLTAIPNDLPEDTICLDLTSNLISTIITSENPFVHLQQLSVLSLSDNLLQSLNKNDFQYLKHLEKLDLSMNRIRYRNITDDAFDLVPNLVYLDLKQNLGEHYPQERFVVKALRKLPNLRTLMIDIRNVGKLGTEFRSLTKLEELYMSGTYGNCSIPIINESFFANMNLSTIESRPFHLFLSDCNITRIDKGALVPLNNLTTVDLSWNQKLTFKQVDNVSEDLGSAHGQSIRFLNLNAVYKYYQQNTCNKIKTALLKPLHNTTLEMLSLDNNYLINVDIQAIKYFPTKVRYLSVRDNMLLLGQYVIQIKQNNALKNLIYYDTSSMFKNHCRPRSAKHHWRRYVNRACLHNTSENKAYFTGAYLKHQSSCCDAMLKRNREQDFVRNILNRVNSILNVEDSDAENINSVRFSNNIPKRIPKDKGLIYLDVSENVPGLVNTSIELFQNLSRLLYLNMSMNLYGYIYFSQDNASIFRNTTQLKVLDMRANRIMHVWQNTFQPLSNLVRLYLCNNRLESFEFYLNHMKNLSFIDLSTNRIETISKNYRNSFNRLTNSSINLLNNKLKCSCSDIEFIKWIQQQTNVHFVDKEHYNCTFDNGTETLLMTIVLPQMYNECFPLTYLVLILALSMSFVVFCIILTGGLVYRYKWNLRYLYYMTKYKMFGGYAVIRDDETEYEKDIFISYASEDSAFVRNHLIPQLQDFSLVIHERDFEAGQYVADNIMKAVSSTRKTLAILTKDYIRSKWCKHEMNMARLQGLDTGKEILCVILMEDIPPRRIPLEIMDIIKRKTYLEYPKEEEHQIQFWERLRATLQNEIY